MKRTLTGLLIFLCCYTVKSLVAGVSKKAVMGYWGAKVGALKYVNQDTTIESHTTLDREFPTNSPPLDYSKYTASLRNKQQQKEFEERPLRNNKYPLGMKETKTPTSNDIIFNKSKSLKRSTNEIAICAPNAEAPQAEPIFAAVPAMVGMVAPHIGAFLASLITPLIGSVANRPATSPRAVNSKHEILDLFMSRALSNTQLANTDTSEYLSQALKNKKYSVVMNALKNKARPLHLKHFQPGGEINGPLLVNFKELTIAMDELNQKRLQALSTTFSAYISAILQNMRISLQNEHKNISITLTDQSKNIQAVNQMLKEQRHQPELDKLYIMNAVIIMINALLAMGLIILRHSITQFVLKYNFKYTGVPTNDKTKEPQTEECTYTTENGFQCRQSPTVERGMTGKTFPTMCSPPTPRSQRRDLLNMYPVGGFAPSHPPPPHPHYPLSPQFSHYRLVDQNKS